MAGLRVNIGTDVKPIHAGRARRVDRRDGSVLGRPRVHELEGVQRGTIGNSAGVRGPGSVGAADVHAGSITIESHPPALKAVPSCGCTHSAIDATLRLQAELPTPGDITHAEVSGPPLFRDVLIHHRPRSGQEAKFGMQGCIALALVDGEVRVRAVQRGVGAAARGATPS